MQTPAHHPRKGNCVIRDFAPSTGRVKVVVDYPSLDLWRRTEYLDELVDRRTNAPIVLAPPSPPEPPQTLSSGPVPAWQRARQTLLALRLGQSTFESVRDLSVGMQEVDEACAWALRRAEAGQLSFLVFESPYGMGKSHALAHLRLRAKEHAMATGGVVLDGVGVSLCLPMSLIASLAHSIEFPDGPASDGLPARLGSLVARCDVDRLVLQGCELLHNVLRRVEPSLAEDPDVWETLEDFLCLEVGAGVVRENTGLVVPALKTRRDDRPSRCAALMREWAQACVATGARNGLALLLDEADVDYAQSGLTEIECEQRDKLFQAWHEIAETGPHQHGYARMIVAIAITPEANEPDPVVELKEQLGRHVRVVKLAELRKVDLQELGDRVCRLYRSAYMLSESEAAAMERLCVSCVAWMEQAAGGRNPRKFIRHLVEKLDGAYL